MKKIALALLIFSAFEAFGQTPDAQPFIYGYSCSAELQSLNVGLLAERPSGPYITAERPGFGAAVGIWGQWRLVSALHLRPAFQFTYTANPVRFWANDGEVERRRYSFADLELPVHFILVSDLQRLPLKGLILFGGRFSWNFASASQSAALRLLPERLGLDVGIGASITLGHWMIQPECMYSYGVNNAHDFTNTPYDWSVGRILRDRLSLRMVFRRLP